MKKLFTVVAVLFVLAGCNNGADKAATKTNEASGAKIEYPYTPEKPYQNWQIGSEENTVAAMKCLKTFVDSDFTAFAATLGDSVDVDLDGFSGKMSRDSAVRFFTAARPMYKDLQITMYDWVSVISADKKAEWVTFWYKQAWKDDKGKADSLFVVDDCKMLNGKMIALDEKVRHYAAKN